MHLLSTLSALIVISIAAPLDLTSAPSRREFEEIKDFKHFEFEPKKESYYRRNFEREDERKVLVK
jgi:hypothetical protein